MDPQSRSILETYSLLKHITDSTGDTIYAKDRQGRMLYANPAALKLIGKPLDQVLGKTDEEFLEDKEAGRQILVNDRAIMETGIAAELEETIPLPDGRVRIWLSQKMPRFDTDGKVIGLLGVSRDITDRKNASQRINRLYNVAAALSEAISPLDVARVTVDQGIAAVGATAGSFGLLTPDGQHLELVGSIGFSREVIDRWQRFSVNEPVPLAEAVRRGEPVYTESAEARLAHYPELAAVTANMKTQSSACLPLIIGDRVVGVLGLSFSTPGPFSSDDRQFMISLARQCAQALERARLFEQEQLARAKAERAECETREVAGKLQRQSRLFERIASTTRDFIYVFDLTGRFIYANRRLLEVWGTTFENAVGKSLNELGYPQWHAEMHMRELRQVIETKKPIKGEVPFTGGSGISGIYEYIFTPVLDDDGNVEVISGITRDITDRRQSEQALRESEARFRQLADAMPQIVWGARTDGVVDYYNRRWFEFIGIPEELGTGSANWDRYVHPEDLPRVNQTWAESLKTGRPYNTEFRVRGADGMYLWFLVRAEPVSNASGVVTRWYGSCTDITDRKRVEEQRQILLETERAARSVAEHASRMKDEFLATLSHELRTPLNAILGWAAILSSGATTEVDLRDGLDTIQRNARAQAQIIEDLLDMSRIISGKVRLELHRTDLAKIVQSAVDTLRPAADAKGVRLSAILDPHASVLSGDPNRLQQVFWNLLTNAVKFTPRDGQVQVLLQRANTHCEITVSDTGEGIREEFLPHVFDRFRQADASTTRRHGGLGLGLAIVKQLVELHGGTVVAQSPGVGKGSTFKVCLPVTAIHAEPESGILDRPRPMAVVGSSGPEEDSLRLNGIRVVVVDDEPDARALLKRWLEDCDAIVRVAGSADEAMALIAVEKPDVVVSDIGMPDEDGYSLIRRIRTLAPGGGGDVPAVALTAYARSEDRVRAIRAGFQTHIVKPADPTELITIVASLVGQTIE